MTAKNIKSESEARLEHIKEDAKETMKCAKEGAMEAVEYAKDAMKVAKGELVAAERKVERAIEKDPMHAVMIATGVGVVIGAALAALIIRRR